MKFAGKTKPSQRSQPAVTITPIQQNTTIFVKSDKSDKSDKNGE